MSALVDAIARSIVDHVQQNVAQLKNADGEFRSVFNGPPETFLRPVLASLETSGGIDAVLATGAQVVVPVVMQVDELPAGARNPAIGASGECDSNHLLDLRNSSTCPRYVAMVPPGKQANLSQTSARSDFGLLAHNNSGTASIADWWRDRFIQALVEDALDRQGKLEDDERAGARNLARHAMFAANDVEDSDTSRQRVWNTMSRIWSIPAKQGGFGKWLSLACGYPPTEDGRIDSDEQIKVLGLVADRIEELGILGAIESCKRDATVLEKEALDACASQLQSRFDALTVLTRALPYYYAPYATDSVEPPPRWWLALTTECWRRLLGQGDDPPPPPGGGVRLECVNQMIPPVPGLGIVVKSDARLKLYHEGVDAGLNARITRAMPGRSGAREWLLPLDGDCEIVDDAIPSHHSPVRYAATLAETRTKPLKLVSLASWSPGILATSRTASKATLPKPPRAQGGQVTYEVYLSLLGEGRHYIDVFTAPSVEVAEIARGSDDGGLPDSSREARVARVSDGEYGFEVDATGECLYDVEFRRGGPAGQAEILRLYLSSEDVAPQECASEYERLLQLNRRKARQGAIPDVQINRQLRSSDLQGWMLSMDQVESSYYPLVIAADYALQWRTRDWASQQDTIISQGRFLNDPRPRREDMVPPRAFLDARKSIASRIRGDDQNGLLESARLGEWISTDTSFAEAVEQYVRCYHEWLEAAPDVAAWCDISIVTRFEADGSTLVQEPHAILVSPLHPVRLGWHSSAQRALFLTYRKSPCPAASVIDPDSVPDAMVLPLRTASGTLKRQVFFSVECTSDYWSILWNASKLGELAKSDLDPPFDREFGVLAGGISSGFSVSQVHRALDDVTEMLGAQPALNLLLTSAAGQNSACNEGLLSWCRERFAEGGARDRLYESLGPRLVHVLDERRAEVRPQDAEIANLAEDTRNCTNWYGDVQRAMQPDIAIIAQLETTNATAEETRSSSAVGAGGMLRARVRQQLSTGGGAFLSETRSGGRAPAGDGGLADKVLAGLLRLENLGNARYSYTFAPSVPTIQSALDRSSLVAVSSAAIDPSCFLGGWLKEAYLWDYDLPSYSGRSGDSNGYYLLSRIKEVDLDALSEVIARLPGCKGLGAGFLENVILEVSRRGIPTVRGLASGDSVGSGDLGLFVASRLLQDEFRSDGNGGTSLLPVWNETDGRVDIALVIPVDPFRGYIDDLMRALSLSTNQRPDLIVAWIKIDSAGPHCKLTPIEVKYRGADATMAPGARREALGQARSLGQLLGQLKEKSSDAEAPVWKIAFQHFLVSMLNFGFRVYSQQLAVSKRGGAQWAERHSQVLEALLCEELDVQTDAAGRLLVIDGSPASHQSDQDGDQLAETITLSRKDAALIVRGEASEVYAAIRSRIGDWGLSPSPLSPKRAGSPAPAAGGVAITPPPKVEPAIATPAPVPQPDPRSIDTSQSSAPADSTGISLLIGPTIDAFQSEIRRLDISDTRLNQLNMGVVGDLGTGKTQLLKSLIFQVSRAREANQGVSPRFLVFDYKRDYSAEEFVRASGARVVTPYHLPLNPFDLAGAGESMTPWLDRFKFFSDVLDKIYTGVGPVQRSQLKAAVRSAYASCATGSSPTIYDIHANYHAIIGSRADSVSGIIDDLVDMELFSPDPRAARGFGEFLNGVVVIALDALGQDDRTKNMLVAIMLNMFYEHMLRIPKRPYHGPAKNLRTIDSFLLVDEADNIMRYEFDVLRKILLQGREFGVGVILASQYLRHFKAGPTDYREPLLTWFIHKVPNVQPQELDALGLTGDVSSFAERIKSLEVHQCLYKTFGGTEDIVRGIPFFELGRDELAS